MVKKQLSTIELIHSQKVSWVDCGHTQVLKKKGPTPKIPLFVNHLSSAELVVNLEVWKMSTVGINLYVQNPSTGNSALKFNIFSLFDFIAYLFKISIKIKSHCICIILLPLNNSM